jgi:hypothetical protein
MQSLDHPAFNASCFACSVWDWSRGTAEQGSSREQGRQGIMRMLERLCKPSLQLFKFWLEQAA